MARIRLHIHVDDDHTLGPGKIALLEAIRQHGSISAAAREMGMAYRHAWELVDDVNQAFPTRVVETSSGGGRGSGARVTAFGEEVIRRFRTMERASRRVVDREMAALERTAERA